MMLVRRVSRRTIGVGGAVALLLASAGGLDAAPRKESPAPKTADKPAATADDAASPSWVADELRILRSEVEALRQRPDSSVASDLAALRAEVSRLASAQGELDRRLGGAPSAAVPGPGTGAGTSMTGAAIYLSLGFALGWVGSQLAHRWRDRRQRIRI
jgi:hypothetical protein